MLRALLYLPLLALCACHYDLDVLYEHADGGSEDTGVGTQVLMSQQLIAAWIGHNAAVDEDCIACAEQNCQDIDSACRNDPSCLAYTQCVGMKPDPAGLTACRAQYSQWVRTGNIREHDLTGPYGQCAFRDRCAVECGGNSDMTCLGKYSWTTASEASVPLHLFLANPFDSKPMPGVNVRVCGERDCPMDAQIVTSDANGLVELTLLTTNFAHAFNGFLELQGAQIVPTLLKFSWNITSETTQVVNVVPTASGSPGTTRGALQLRMFGCGGLGVRGVSFEASNTDDMSKTWYYDNGLSFEATATSAVGSGGVTNVPPGETQVTAVRREGDTKQVVANTTATVRAGFMTVVIFVPGPAQ